MREAEEETKPRGRARLKQALRSLRLIRHGAWEGEEALRLALDGIGLGVWEVDLARGERRWSPAQFRIFGCPPTPDGVITENTWRDRLHPEDAARVQAAYAQCQAEGRLFEAEYRVRRADTGEERWVSAYGHFQRRGEGDPGRITGVTIDITERRRAEARQQLLEREYNHRIRNLLALVSSIAEQTWRMASSPEHFHAALIERLQALGGAHALLTHERWQGASLRALAEQVLAPYLTGAEQPRVTIEGPTVHVAPLTAISLSMALHELATNAAKYGALSGESGRVSVRWAIEAAAAASKVRLEWLENGGPPVTPPERRGFGSRLIERGLAVELGGDVQLDFRPEGVYCSLLFDRENGTAPP